MTPTDIVLLSAVCLMVFNNVLLRLPGWEHRRWLFWPLQLLNVAAGSYLISFGIPGFEGKLKYASWMIGLLFFWHTVSNNNRLLAARRTAEAEEDDETKSKRAAIEAALKRGREE